ncbi:acetyltransferase, GNAT family protein [Entamoeba histolytica HM-1:IMSS-B]|uniref:Acetyltransferase, GNAT family n=4 Tax=Entamoeba histolytica TaxID=5759 RepID=C4M6K7_ENTH1|nr:acetyltransferase, GNAT family [Entamoeba histolytica HM-1:IMSS]EAL47026.1 acetyltransferase, GNAT family [Entamoeba histolytica HM-1:IMSS]EMH74563.1 acetyltransferase, GNAT family protein [Entamoeba histolytica HM-1:IMSS-B]ENY64675.1 acetyltransferase, GNAT family protein, putative [Entamoeba histolytica HM-1:IMSS-A]GAT97125.1 acetyltransferase gnat family [Entamoeba histolytica]|eukprot:XP_652397.1 acetyltransferase, GNAT family [Entamoeba histolytica HM-1:IMSS]
MDFESKIVQLKDIPKLQEITKITFYSTYNDNLLSPEARDAIYKYLYNTEQLKQQINSNYQFVFHYVNLQLFGYTGIEYNSSEDYCYLHDFYLLPSFRGQGLGHKLMDKVKDMAIEHHYKKIHLNCHQQNTARQFYEKQGFHFVKNLNTIFNGFDLLDMEMEFNF